MTDDQHSDVVFMRTGAGGGTLGHRLATNGAKILWLVRGPFLPCERDDWRRPLAAIANALRVRNHLTDCLG